MVRDDLGWPDASFDDDCLMVLHNSGGYSWLDGICDTPNSDLVCLGDTGISGEGLLPFFLSYFFILLLFFFSLKANPNFFSLGWFRI